MSKASQAAGTNSQPAHGFSRAYSSHRPGGQADGLSRGGRYRQHAGSPHGNASSTPGISKPAVVPPTAPRVPTAPAAPNAPRAPTAPAAPNAPRAPAAPAAPAAPKLPVAPAQQSFAKQADQFSLTQLEDLFYDLQSAARPPQPGDRSLAAEVEEAVRQGIREHPLKPSGSAAVPPEEAGKHLQIQWKREASTLEEASTGVPEAPPVSASGLAKELKPQPMEEAEAADRHELPKRSVEAEEKATQIFQAAANEATTPSNAASSTLNSQQQMTKNPTDPQPLSTNTANVAYHVPTGGSGFSRVPPKLPFAPAKSSSHPAAASERIVVTSVPPQDVPSIPAVIHCEEEASSLTELISAMSRAIDTLEGAAVKGEAPNKRRDVLLTSHKRNGAAFFAVKTIVAIPSFSSADEGKFNEANAFLKVERERLLLLKRIRQHKQFRFVACAESNAFDFGAELFFAAHERQIAMRSSSTESASSTAGTPGAFSVGFPSISLGWLPSLPTVRMFQETLGMEQAALWIPALHRVDVECLRGTTLLPHALDQEEPINPSASAQPASVAPHQPQRIGQLTPIAERVLLWCIKNPRVRGFMTDHLLLSSSFHSKLERKGIMEKVVAEQVLSAVRYADDATGELAFQDLQMQAVGHPAMARLREARAAVSQTLLNDVPLPKSEHFTEFRGDRVSQWAQFTQQLQESPQQRHTVLFDFSPRFASHSATLVAKLCAERNNLKGFRVVLVGDKNDARAAIALLEDAVLISPACPLRYRGTSDLQEVSVVHSTSTLAASRRDELLISGCGYLQERGTPFVVTGGDATDRLIAALALEACRIVQVVPPERLETVTKEVLGISPGLLGLLDYYGADRLLQSIQNCPTTPAAEILPVAAREALLRMKLHNLKGRTSSAGGFYSYDRDSSKAGSSGHEEPIMRLNPHVFKHFLRPDPSKKELSDRVIFALVNECCGLLADGRVMNAADANLLTMAVGLGEETGGALAIADDVTIPVVVQRMRVLAGMYGASLAPHPLLLAMTENQQCFSTLSEGTIAKAQMLMRSNHSR
jgi:hypothetical protein